MTILHNDQHLKPFLSQFKISSFSVFVLTTSRLCVGFEADLIVMGKTGHLLRYLQSNCTLPTTLNFILYYTIPYHTIPYHTIPYYAMLCSAILCYSMLCHAMLYCTILYFTILCYTHTIPYYTHSIVILTRFWGDSDCLTLKLPETGILVAQ